MPSFKVPPTMEGNPFFTEVIKAKAYAASEAAATNIGRAYSAGVKIAFGTDSAVTPHGLNGQEFELMVQVGFSEMDAIYAATLAAADLLSYSDQIGSIEAGKQADIIATDGNPLDDITELERVTTVIKSGRLVR